MEFHYYLVAAAVCLVAIIYRMYYLDEKKNLIRKIPSPPGHLLVGNALQLKSDAAEFYKYVMKIMSPYPGMGAMWLCNYPLVMVFSGSTAEVLLCSSKHIEKSADYDPLHDWLGLGLLTSTGAKWKDRRHLLTPTFHFDVLKSFLPVFTRHAATLVDKMRCAASNSDTLDVFPLITRNTLDIICETAMGKNLDIQNEGHAYYVDAVYRASELISLRQRRPWLWSSAVFGLLPQGRQFRNAVKVLHDFTNSVIDERRTELRTEQLADQGTGSSSSGALTAKRMAFLDLLLHMEPALSRDDIREEVDTFMFEGHDTTAAALAWCIHLVGSHQDVQQKIHEELRSIFGDSGRDIDHDDLKRLPYLECVIKETLRLFPSVPWFGRRLSENALIGGYEVPSGTTVLIFTSLLHRDPKVYPEPEKFDPDRFAPEKSAKRHPYAYVPFSAGMRNCIGQKFALTELKVVLAYVFRNFTVEAAQKTDDLNPVADLILRPSNGILVKLTPHCCGL